MGPGIEKSLIDFPRLFPHTQGDAQAFRKPLRAGHPFDGPNYIDDKFDKSWVPPFAGLEHYRAKTMVSAPEGLVDNLHFGELVTRNGMVTTADAAVTAVAATDIGKLDDTAKIDCLAAVGQGSVKGLTA